MNMKTSSVLVGMAVEGALIAALIWSGGIGPCGPGSPVSAFVLLLHGPGLAFISTLQVPDWLGVSLVLGFYTAMWSMGSLFVLRAR